MRENCNQKCSSDKNGNGQLNEKNNGEKRAFPSKRALKIFPFFIVFREKIVFRNHAEFFIVSNRPAKMYRRRNAVALRKQHD